MWPKKLQEPSASTTTMFNEHRSQARSFSATHYILLLSLVGSTFSTGSIQYKDYPKYSGLTL
jgi:hypothetical protein